MHRADLVDIPVDELFFNLCDDVCGFGAIDLAILFSSYFLFLEQLGFQVSVSLKPHPLHLVSSMFLLQLLKVYHLVIVCGAMLQRTARKLIRLGDADSAVFVWTAKLPRCQMNLPLFHWHADVAKLERATELIVVRECLHFALQDLFNVGDELFLELLEAFLGRLFLVS